MNKIKYSLSICLLAFLCGCSIPYYDIDSEVPDKKIEPFSANVVGNFKGMVDEGWRVTIQNRELIFIRESEAGTEIFKPAK